MMTFAEIGWEAAGIRERAAQALQLATQDKVKSLAGDLNALGLDGQAGLLRLAVIGQYNGGKTSLISALTDRRDLKIEADITTDMVTRYDWHEVRLYDTPGIHAGRRDHDEKTYAAIDSADLLLYVVTDEGFSPAIAEDFRRIAFERNRGPEMMLVVNKTSQHAQEQLPNVRAKVLQWCEPLTAEDLRLTFTDAKNYLDADNESDPELAAALRQESGIEDLVREIDRFVRDRGLLGKLTSPLHGLVSVLRNALSFLGTDSPELQAGLELLRQKRAILARAKNSAERDLPRLVDQMAAKVRNLGDEVAEAVEGEQEEQVRQAVERSRQRLNSYEEQLKTDIERRLAEIVEDANRDLEQLAQGELALRFAEVEERAGSILRQGGGVSGPNPSTGGRIDLTGVQQTLSAAQKTAIGIVRLAQGPAFKGILDARGVAGSHLHTLVFETGKLFKSGFRAADAAAVTARISKIFGAIGNILGLTGPVIQAFQEGQEDQKAADLLRLRREVRAGYAQVAVSLADQYRERIQQALRQLLDVPLQAIDRELVSARQQAKAATQSEVLLRHCLAEMETLIGRVQHVEQAVGHEPGS